MELYTRKIAGKLHVWDVQLMRCQAEHLPVTLLPLEKFDLAKMFWFTQLDQASVLAVVSHAQKIMAASLEEPIIVSADGTVMDGMHRLAKAFIEDAAEVKCRQFMVDPPPLAVVAGD